MECHELIFEWISGVRPLISERIHEKVAAQNVGGLPSRPAFPSSPGAVLTVGSVTTLFFIFLRSIMTCRSRYQPLKRGYTIQSQKKQTDVDLSDVERLIRNELVYSKGRGAIPVKKVWPSWSHRAIKAVTSWKEENATHLDRITAGMWMGMISKNLLASQFMVLLMATVARYRDFMLTTLTLVQRSWPGIL